jgi:hypothetical protein
MFPLVLIGTGIAAAALAATWYAVVTAEEGYEDEDGFHSAPRERTRRAESEVCAAGPDETKTGSEIRRCATLR